MRVWEIKVAKQQPRIVAMLMQLCYGAALPRTDAGLANADARRFVWDAFGEGAFSCGEEPAAKTRLYS